MVHMHQPQYLPAGVGVSGGCVTLPSSTRCQDLPPSSVTSTSTTARSRVAIRAIRRGNLPADEQVVVLGP